MGKARLAVCIEDPIYQERFVKCLMHHYKEKYEMHSFSNLVDLKDIQAGEFDLFVLEGKGLEKKAKKLAERKENVLFLSEGQEKNVDHPNLVFGEMFQEVYKIMEVAEQLLGQKGMVIADSVKRIGVYSLECPALQIPYSAMLASIYGETKKVLAMHVLPHTGVSESQEETLCFEDIVASLSTGNHKSKHLLSAIGHMAKWDYIYPVRNTEHLAEIDRNAYEDIIEGFIKEQGYEIVIINFGTPFSGMFDFMDSCEEFYFLQKKGSIEGWREEDFRQELKRRGKDEFSNRISKVEIPFASSSDETWQGLAEKWEWGVLGDHVRKKVRRKNPSG